MVMFEGMVSREVACSDAWIVKSDDEKKRGRAVNAGEERKSGIPVSCVFIVVSNRSDGPYSSARTCGGCSSHSRTSFKLGCHVIAKSLFARVASGKSTRFPDHPRMHSIPVFNAIDQVQGESGASDSKVRD